PTKSLPLPANFGEPNGATGAGVAGGAAINVIDDTTLAYMNLSGSATVGKLTFNATDNATIVAVSGGVALAFKGGVVNSTCDASTKAGSFSLNQTTADTEAFLKGVSLTSNAPLVAGAEQISITALREGIVTSGSAAISANTTGQGSAGALSISIDRVVDTTKA